MANIIQTFPNGAGGGHEVLENGVAVPQEKKLDFNGLSVTDDSTNEKTVIEGVGLNQDSLDDIGGASLPGTILAGSGFNYSTSEQIIGRWVDGKPLYQKTFTLSGLTMSDNATSLNTPNIDKIVYATGLIRKPSDGSVILLDHADGYGAQYGVYLNINPTTQMMYIDAHSYTGFPFTEGVVTMQYTKTTD